MVEHLTTRKSSPFSAARVALFIVVGLVAVALSGSAWAADIYITVARRVDNVNNWDIVEAGTLTPAEGSHKYTLHATEVTKLAATENVDYNFVGWKYADGSSCPGDPDNPGSILHAQTHRQSSHTVIGHYEQAEFITFVREPRSSRIGEEITGTHTTPLYWVTDGVLVGFSYPTAGVVDNPAREMMIDIKRPEAFDGSGPGTPGARMFGTKLLKPDGNGLVNFTDLIIDRVGDEYQLRAHYHIFFTVRGNATQYENVRTQDSATFDIVAGGGYVTATGYNQYGQLGVVRTNESTPYAADDPRLRATVGYYGDGFDPGTLTAWPHFNVSTGFGGKPGWWMTADPNEFPDYLWDTHYNDKAWWSWPLAVTPPAEPPAETLRDWHYPTEGQPIVQGMDHYEHIAADNQIWQWRGAGGEADGHVQQAVAAGRYHSLSLRSDGRIKAWGYNVYGQIGDGTTDDQYQPVLLNSPTDVIAISAGMHHSAALTADGTVWTWGYNNYGQLGHGTASGENPNSTPQQIAGLADIVAISAGDWHTLALRRDGSVWAWGFNADGELGDGSTTHRYSPVQTHFYLSTLIGHTDNVNAVAYFESGGDEYVITGSSDNTAKLWNAETGVLIRTFDDADGDVPYAHKHTELVKGVAFYEAGLSWYVATCAADRTVKLWNGATGMFIRDLVDETLTGVSAGKAHEGGVNSVVFSPDGTKILTASVDRTAKLWDRDTGALEVVFDAGGGADKHEASVNEAIFAMYDGQPHVVTGSADKTAKLWLATGGFVHTFVDSNLVAPNVGKSHKGVLYRREPVGHELAYHRCVRQQGQGVEPEHRRTGRPDRNIRIIG